MEISDYLKVIRRRVGVLLLVPLIAGLAVAALVLLSPPKYTATATVAAPAVVGGASSSQYSGSTGTRAFVANFSAAITSPPILDKVSKQTGVGVATLRDGLTVKPLGESSLIEVDYVTTNEDSAVKVVRTASGQTIRFLFETQAQVANQTLENAKKAVAEADAALVKFATDTGQPQPDQAYQSALSTLSTLEVQKQRYLAEGNPSAAANIDSEIRTLTAQSKTLGNQALTYNSLVDTKNAAVERLTQVSSSAEAAATQLAAADPGTTITVGRAKAESKTSALVRSVLPAVGAGVFLAVFGIVLLEIAGRRNDDDLTGQGPVTIDELDAAATRPDNRIGSAV